MTTDRDDDVPHRSAGRGRASAAGRRAGAAVVVGLLIVGFAGPAAGRRLATHAPGADDEVEVDTRALGDEVVALVAERFLDPARAADWAERHAGYGAGVAPGAAFAARTRELLAELATSHTGYYTPDDPEHAGLLAVFGEGLGLDVAPVDHLGADIGRDGLVRAVFADGPAARADLRRGDRLELPDGASFEPVASLRGRAGAPLTLRVLRGDASHEVEVVPERAPLRDVWRASLRDGVAVHELDGRHIGYVPVFSCAGDFATDGVRDAITGPLRDCEALVLDLRGGWGGCSPDFVDLFHAAVPVLEFVGRDGEAVRLDDRWRAPLVLLVDGGSRSGKELVAHAVRRYGLGTLVGQRTAGAVVGGSVFPLSDGSLLYLAVSDVTVDGLRLEGVGVAPHVQVADAPPGSGGWDPQLDEALRRAARLARDAERAARRAEESAEESDR